MSGPGATWGALFKKQGKLEESIAAFQRQVEISPNSAEAWSGLGSAFWRQENHAAAADAFARGLAVQPKHLALLSNDAELALVQGDKDRFHARIADSVATGHNQGPTLCYLAVLGMAGQPYPGLGQCHDGHQKVRTRRHLQLEFFDHRTRHSTSGCVNPTDSTTLHRIFHRPDRPANPGRTSYRPVESAGGSGRTSPPPGYRRAPCLPKSPFPRLSPQGTLEVPLSPILSGLSMSCWAVLRLAASRSSGAAAPALWT